MPNLRCFQVDAFTDRPFAGNPAAVCLLDKPLNEEQMQSIAAEKNLSETAYVVPLEKGLGLRWFTPTVEVALCGHATLASAHVLWNEGIVERQEEIEFHTKSGVLTACRVNEVIQLNFPAQKVEAALASPGLEEALGETPSYFGKTREDGFVVFDSEDKVRSLNPDFRLLAKLAVRGMIVTSRSENERFDFVSRFFAPHCGIDEDPVTGSAHCSLAPYWAEVLEKENLVGYQASLRGGIVKAGVRDDRVLLGGQAVTVLRGEFLCP